MATNKTKEQQACPHCRKPIKGGRAVHIRACRPHNKAYAIVHMDSGGTRRSFKNALEIRVLDDRENETALIEVRRQAHNGQLSIGVWIGETEMLNVPIPKVPCR